MSMTRSDCRTAATVIPSIRSINISWPRAMLVFLAGPAPAGKFAGQSRYHPALFSHEMACEAVFLSNCRGR
jgi:hypothetical protein